MDNVTGSGLPGSRPALWAASLLWLAGCGGAADSTTDRQLPATDSSTATPAVPASALPGPASVPASGPNAEVRTIPLAGLPIGDYLPPLDDGRIELPIPGGWSPLPRDSSYLVRFYKDDRNGLPRIEVLASDSTFDGITEVTDQTVAAFAAAVSANLQSEGKKLAEPVVPLRIGDVYGARYVLQVELRMAQGSVVAERQTVVVLKRGRVYTIHLLVLPGKLLADRDAAYAICAGMK